MMLASSPWHPKPVLKLRSIFEEGDVKKIRMGNLAIMGANKAHSLEERTEDHGLEACWR